MKKLVLLGITALLAVGLTGCPVWEPEPEPEPEPHIDYPDWNENKVDDETETLSPGNGTELLAIINYYQEEHKYKRWMAKSIDVSQVNFSAPGWLETAGGDLESFNPDVSNWDVSNVTNMSGMFAGTKSFNQDLSKWDVSNVIDMSGMFEGAESFDDYGLRDWATKIDQVEDFSRMFYEVGGPTAPTGIHQDLSPWDITGKPSSGMFYGTYMEYLPNEHPMGCRCGTSSSDPENWVGDPWGEWSHQ